tara:strand:+ start:11758 stop:12129 length:372 start_codon:yes stop_codon:yes gene_type:complete
VNNLDHRAGVTEVNLVHRKIKLIGLTALNRMEIINEIDAAFGIDFVTIDFKDALLHIAYDATHINLDAIEDIILKHGADVSDGWWAHLKEGYYKFVDENIMENAKHKPLSCHQAPPRSKKTSK